MRDKQLWGKNSVAAKRQVVRRMQLFPPGTPRPALGNPAAATMLDDLLTEKPAPEPLTWLVEERPVECAQLALRSAFDQFLSTRRATNPESAAPVVESDFAAVADWMTRTPQVRDSILRLEPVSTLGLLIALVRADRREDPVSWVRANQLDAAAAIVLDLMNPLAAGSIRDRSPILDVVGTAGLTAVSTDPPVSLRIDSMVTRASTFTIETTVTTPQTAWRPGVVANETRWLGFEDATDDNSHEYVSAEWSESLGTDGPDGLHIRTVTQTFYPCPAGSAQSVTLRSEFCFAETMGPQAADFAEPIPVRNPFTIVVPLRRRRTEP